MAIKKIGVVGAGAMGTGIAHTAAQSGYDVILCDVAENYLQRSIGNIAAVFDKSIAKGKLTEEQKQAVLGRIHITTDLQEMHDADLVIEAIIENMDAKFDLFKKLDEICDSHTILSSNTSTMSITKLAAATKRSAQFAGMHFFNPVPVMRLVEVIRGYDTSDQTVATLLEVTKALGKEGIEVKKDSPGFVVNRLMLPQIREAFILADEGIASIEDIDKAMMLGLNHPMGPFTLMDFAGNDICYYSLEYLHSEYAQPNWAPPTNLKRLINAGRLGRKTGKGWYDYNK